MAHGGSVLVGHETLEDVWFVKERPDAVLCAIADGMGGTKSGRPAAELLVAMLADAFDERATTDEILGAPG